ncbi:NAD-dependent epimerase/dehydratase family protein [Rhodopirellula sp. MGV]|uniref:NAD-dependent epimerase/dehydratase family protein n=1 Tax=Rhodopirellula sp. MGV TaxID=2023130 RepID=UPI000B961E4E|nr:NAD-dependent epimerase/dehydratase family protein [Rhodopirellula sp. MGV]OYP33006.1 hypothetical protein CGZ80_19145 [Rhodopirellula sp. MGV]PNY35334.1 hypothetical protein C2E31_17550 [Rhodopirellula baltica]
MMKVAVLGASGLVGATVVSQLASDPEIQILPLIHSTGRAWRLARLGIDLETADVMDLPQLTQKLQGCTHVVNCSRGPEPVMLKGIENILAACRQAEIQRLVHLSSVSSYGDIKDISDVTEDQPIGEIHSAYSRIKAEQDRKVRAAVSKGLDCISLCPPMITGVHAGFLTGLIKQIKSRRFALVDEGNQPFPSADVLNVAHAIICALKTTHAVNGRVFVTDGRTATWSELAYGLAKPLGIDHLIGRVSLEEATRIIEKSEGPKASLTSAAKHLASSNVRDALKRDPWFASAEKSAKKLILKMPNPVINKLKGSGGSGKVRRRVKPTDRLDGPGLWRQLRGLTFSIEKAMNQLGYTPVVDFDESLASFHRWYADQTGINGENADLLKFLDPVPSAL